MITMNSAPRTYMIMLKTVCVAGSSKYPSGSFIPTVIPHSSGSVSFEVIVIVLPFFFHLIIDE